MDQISALRQTGEKYTEGRTICLLDFVFRESLRTLKGIVRSGKVVEKYEKYLVNCANSLCGATYHM